MKHNIIIAIDGTAASGKGTLAKKLAERLHYAYLDTGALYRLVAKKLLDSGKTDEDEEAAVAMAHVFRANMTLQDLEDPAIRTDEVGRATSRISAYPGVRAALLDLQRDFAVKPPSESGGNPCEGAILDGRDIGTVVCPDADIKIYVDADEEIRVKRRHKELQFAGIPVTYDAVLADMRERDARDGSRKEAPMKPAGDAHILNTSALSIDEVLEQALSLIEEKTRDFR